MNFYYFLVILNDNKTKFLSTTYPETLRLTLKTMKNFKNRKNLRPLAGGICEYLTLATQVANMSIDKAAIRSRKKGVFKYLKY